MSEPFLAEVRIFAGNFAPRGWAVCNGQLLPISQNTALFSLVGVTYGGDGRTTFALPNLQDRAPMHPGRGPGLTTRSLGESGGTESVTLTEAQMPNHTHSLVGSGTSANDDDPTDDVLGAAVGANIYAPPGGLVGMASQSLANTGGSQPHNNMQPYLGLTFIIAQVGLYPSRS